MKWLGVILVTLGLTTPLMSLPFVTVQTKQNFILTGFVELSQGTPRYEPKSEL